MNIDDANEWLAVLRRPINGTWLACGIAAVAVIGAAAGGFSIHAGKVREREAAARRESASAAVCAANLEFERLEIVESTEFIRFFERRADEAKKRLAAAGTPAAVAVAQDDLQEARRELAELRRRKADAEAKVKAAESLKSSP